MSHVFYATLTAVRESNTTQYGTNEEWSNDDTSPTAYTIPEMAQMSGRILDATIVSTNDPTTLLQGELWLFQDATTLVNDNAAFTLSDADALNWIGIIPFTLASSTAGSGTNSLAHVIDYNVGFDLRTKANGAYARIKVKNAYTPASAETLTIRLKIERSA